MKTRVDFFEHVGKRNYFLRLEFDGDINRYYLEENRIIKLLGKNYRIAKCSHKDWSRAFKIDDGQSYFTVVEYKKTIKSLQVDSHGYTDDLTLTFQGRGRC